MTILTLIQKLDPYMSFLRYPAMLRYLHSCLFLRDAVRRAASKEAALLLSSSIFISTLLPTFDPSNEFRFGIPILLGHSHLRWASAPFTQPLILTRNTRPQPIVYYNFCVSIDFWPLSKCILMSLFFSQEQQRIVEL